MKVGIIYLEDFYLLEQNIRHFCLIYTCLSKYIIPMFEMHKVDLKKQATERSTEERPTDR